MDLAELATHKMPPPAERVIALAPRVCLAMAVPIAGMWVLAAWPRKKSEREKKEENEELERRARMLAEMVLLPPPATFSRLAVAGIMTVR